MCREAVSPNPAGKNDPDHPQGRGGGVRVVVLEEGIALHYSCIRFPVKINSIYLKLNAIDYKNE